MDCYCCTICSAQFRRGRRGHGRDALDAELCPFFFLRQFFGRPLICEGELSQLISSGDNPSEALPLCDNCYAQVLEAKSLFGQVAQLQSRISEVRSGIKELLFKRNTRRKETGLKGLIMDKLKGEEEENGKIADLTLSPQFQDEEEEEMGYFGGYDDDGGFDDDEFALGPENDVKPASARKTPKYAKKAKAKARKSPKRIKEEREDEQKPESESEFTYEVEGQCQNDDWHIKDEPLSSEEEFLDDEYVPTKSPPIPKKKSESKLKPKSKGKPKPKVPKPDPVELPPKEPRIGPNGELINPVGRPRGRRRPKYTPVPKKLYFCPLCSPSWAYTETTSVLNHLKKEHEPAELVPKFCCDICPKGYLKEDWLSQHKEKEHKPEPENENEDEDSDDFDSSWEDEDEPKRRWEAVKLRSGPQRELWLDKNLMKAIELRTCTSCHKLFNGIQTMQKHFDLVHSGVAATTFMCHMCPKIYRHKDSLEKHLKEHETPTIFSCNYCPLTFPRKGDLVLHFRVHSEQGGVLICNICGMGFRHAFSLKRHHLTRHAPEEICPRFECHICGKVFKQKSSLTLHLDSISHGGNNTKERERRAKRKRDRKREKQMPVLILPSAEGGGGFSGNFAGSEEQVGDLLVEVVMEESV